MEKRCFACQKSKNKSEFNKNSSRKDGLQSRCRECDKKRAKEIYHNDPNGAKKANTRKKRNAEKVRENCVEYLKDNPCEICGESDIVVLEFDHKHNKKRNVSTMLDGSCSWKKVLNEIRKCRILCANCHRRETAKKFNYWKLGC